MKYTQTVLFKNSIQKYVVIFCAIFISMFLFSVKTNSATPVPAPEIQNGVVVTNQSDDAVAGWISPIENSNSLFVGMYKVKSSKYVENIIVSDNLIELGHSNNFTGYKYELEEVDFLKDLNNRLVIDWGKGFRSWAQWLDEEKDKEVIEIRPKGYVDDFPGYEDVFLDYSELEKIIKYPNANKIWYQKLSAVAGIYLITDQFTGKHYIGSAYGKEGIAGRWKTYVDKSMKENKDLIGLSNKNNESYKYKFTFTILRTLSKALSKNEVIEKENSYKRRLGSKEFGLNNN